MPIAGVASCASFLPEAGPTISNNYPAPNKSGSSRSLRSRGDFNKGWAMGIQTATILLREGHLRKKIEEATGLPFQPSTSPRRANPTSSMQEGTPEESWTGQKQTMPHERARPDRAPMKRRDDYEETKSVLRIMYDRLRHFLDVRTREEPNFLATRDLTDTGVDEAFVGAIPPLDDKARPASLANYAKVVCGLIDMATYLTEAELANKRIAEGPLEGTPEGTPSNQIRGSSPSNRRVSGACEETCRADRTALEETITTKTKIIEEKEKAIDEAYRRISDLSTELEKMRCQMEHSRNLMSKYKEKCDELEKLRSKQDKNHDSSWLTNRILAEIKKQEELQRALEEKDRQLEAKDEDMAKLELINTNRIDKIKGLMEQVDQLESTLDSVTNVTKHPLDPYGARRLFIERPPCAQSPVYEVSPEQDELEVAEAIAEGKSSALKKLDGNLRAIVAQWPGLLASPPFDREELKDVIGFYYPCGQAPPREWYMLREYQIIRDQGSWVPRGLGCQIGNDRHEPYRIMIEEVREILNSSGIAPQHTPPRRHNADLNEEEMNSGDRLYMASGSRSVSPEIKSKRPVNIEGAPHNINTLAALPPDFEQDEVDRLAQERERRIRARRALHVVLPRDLPKIQRLRQEEGIDRAEARTKTPEELAASRVSRQQELAQKIETAREALKLDGNPLRRASAERHHDFQSDSIDAQVKRPLLRPPPPPPQDSLYSSPADTDLIGYNEVTEGYLGDHEEAEECHGRGDDDFDDAANRKRKRPIKTEVESTSSPEHFQRRQRDLFLRHQQSAELQGPKWSANARPHDRWHSQAEIVEKHLSSDDGSDSSLAKAPITRQKLSFTQTQPRSGELLSRDMQFGANRGIPPRSQAQETAVHPKHYLGHNFIGSSLRDDRPGPSTIPDRSQIQTAAEVGVPRGSGRDEHYYLNPPYDMPSANVAMAASQIVEATMRDNTRPQPPKMDTLDPGPVPVMDQKELYSGKRTTEAEFQVYKEPATPPWHKNEDRFVEDLEPRDIWVERRTPELPARHHIGLEVRTAVVQVDHSGLETPTDKVKKGKSLLKHVLGTNVSSALLPTEDVAFSAVESSNVDRSTPVADDKDEQATNNQRTKAEYVDAEEEQIGADAAQNLPGDELVQRHEADGGEASDIDHDATVQKGPSKRLRSAPKKSSSTGNKKARKHPPSGLPMSTDDGKETSQAAGQTLHITRARAAAVMDDKESAKEDAHPVVKAKTKAKAASRRKRGSDEETPAESHAGNNPAKSRTAVEAADPEMSKDKDAMKHTTGGRLGKKGSTIQATVDSPKAVLKEPTAIAKASAKRKARKGAPDRLDTGDTNTRDDIVSEGSAEPPSAATEPAPVESAETTSKAPRNKGGRKAVQHDSELESAGAVTEPPSEVLPRTEAAPKRSTTRKGRKAEETLAVDEPALPKRKGRKGSAEENGEPQTEPKSEAAALGPLKALPKVTTRNAGKKMGGGESAAGAEPMGDPKTTTGANGRSVVRKGSGLMVKNAPMGDPGLSTSVVTPTTTTTTMKLLNRKDSATDKRTPFTQPPDHQVTVEIEVSRTRVTRSQGRPAQAVESAAASKKARPKKAGGVKKIVRE